jgi:hypothetical protein
MPSGNVLCGADTVLCGADTVLCGTDNASYNASNPAKTPFVISRKKG